MKPRVVMREYLDTKATILPCPFCGGKKQYIDASLQNNMFTTDENGKEVKLWMVTVHCHKCGATVHRYDADKEKAAEFARNAWRSRV